MKVCIICNKNEVYPMNEVDVGVGTLTSDEPSICEECCDSEEARKILQGYNSLCDAFIKTISPED